MVIISIIALFWVGVVHSTTDYGTKMAYYSTVINLQKGGSALTTKGYKDSDGKLINQIPSKALDFCNDMSQIYNIIGTANCNASTNTNFNPGANSNFTISNGAVFYNIAAAPTISKTQPSDCTVIANYCADNSDTTNFNNTSNSDYWSAAASACSANGKTLATSAQFKAMAGAGIISSSAPHWLLDSTGLVGQYVNGGVYTDTESVSEQGRLARCVKPNISAFIGELKYLPKELLVQTENIFNKLLENFGQQRALAGTCFSSTGPIS